MHAPLRTCRRRAAQRHRVVGTAAALGAALALALPAAYAQGSAAAQDPTEDTDDDAFEGDVLASPGEGHVPLVIEATRGGPFAIGVSPAPLRTARPGAAFSDEVGSHLCRTPCTLYVRPGARRLFGDADTGFPWTVDVTVPASRGLRVRLRGHALGYSALGGTLFFLGMAASVGGPALIVVSAIVGQPRLPVAVMVAGGIATALGVFTLWASLRLVDLASPRLESATPPDAPRARAARARSHRVAGVLLPAPVESGAALVGTLVF